MALIKCKDCKKEFSTDARRCPNCGAYKPTSKVVKIFWYFWLISFIGFVAWVELRDVSPEEKAAQELEKTLHDAGYACKSYMKDSLNDPGSAEFDTPVVTPATNNAGGSGVSFNVRMSLRAKNAFGALVGGITLCTVEKTGDNYRVIWADIAN